MVKEGPIVSSLVVHSEDVELLQTLEFLLQYIPEVECTLFTEDDEFYKEDIVYDDPPRDYSDYCYCRSCCEKRNEKAKKDATVREQNKKSNLESFEKRQDDLNILKGLFEKPKTVAIKEEKKCNCGTCNCKKTNESPIIPINEIDQLLKNYVSLFRNNLK
jgi:hypothetical protein